MPAATPSDERPASTCRSVRAPFVGTLCPARDGRRHPAIVLFGGSQGGDPLRDFARDFAAHGYVAASVQYFGGLGTPPTLVDVPVEIGGGVVDALRARTDVDPQRIAVFGTSKGGEYALLVAATYPTVKAVIAATPAPFSWYGLGARSMPTGCSWSQGGKPLPCVPQSATAKRQVEGMFATHEPLAFVTSYDQSRADADAGAIEAAFFPLERIAGPVLCLAGEDDQMWNARAHCNLAMAYLRDHQHPYPDATLSLPGAGHVFLIARKGPRSAVSSVRFGGYEMRFGGTPEADAAAASVAWPKIYAFLDAAFGPTAPGPPTP